MMLFLRTSQLPVGVVFIRQWQEGSDGGVGDRVEKARVHCFQHRRLHILYRDENARYEL